ncbi:transcription factor HES-1-like isoform X2 [Zootermopsis nevadensis]|uniref:transcription factor HES-1-like isoform X2 n=1 Tax=Zootermopsis nevadensis TaxID=136037 RepID=UPI000B8E4751|nr:transcription factor HES-1-like isoform X2 [Zootermopsis nevadensis]
MTARLVSSSNNNNNNKNKHNNNNNNKDNSGGISVGVGSRPSDGRRANKPLMEKRRRARINQSLAVLKTLILDSARLENTKHSKLEKADILELTVRHLQRQRALGSAVLNKYRAGFQECTREVSRFLESSDLALTPGAPTPALDPAIKQRLLRHLDTCVAELDMDFCPEGDRDAVKAEADSEARPDSSTTVGGDENNNGAASSSGDKDTPQPTEADRSPETVTAVATTSSPSSATSNMLSVVQVIPSRLPDGQVVFLLPSHYVQLAAAAAASEVGSPATSSTATAWAISNDKICIENNASIVPIDDSIDSESLSDQPIDFTIAKRRENGILEDVKEEGPVWRPW